MEDKKEKSWVDEMKEINDAVHNKWYKVCFGDQKPHYITGKIQNFSSDKIVLFNDQSRDIAIFKYRDIESMMPFTPKHLIEEKMKQDKI